MKTLILLIPGFPSDESDSTCLPAQQQFVLALQKINPGIEVVVFAFQYPYKKEIYRWNGIEVHAFNGQNRGKLKRVLMWNAVWKRLRMMKAGKGLIGILSFWCGECALVGTKFGRMHGIRHFNWIMGQDAKKENKFVHWIRPGEEELIALSDSLSDEFWKNHGVRPFRVITNFVSPYFLPQRARREIDLLAAGSLIPLKQYDLFIRLIAEVKRDFFAVKSLIAGEGPERHYLKELIHQFKLHEEISLVGEIPHSQLLDLMSRTKVFLHPSNYEGFSSVCLEALAAGSHVVSFCKPMKEDIDHWHIVKNEEEMRKKVSELLTNENLDHTPIIYLTAEGAAEQITGLFIHQ